ASSLLYQAALAGTSRTAIIGSLCMCDLRANDVGPVGVAEVLVGPLEVEGPALAAQEHPVGREIEEQARHLLSSFALEIPSSYVPLSPGYPADQGLIQRSSGRQ